MSISALFSEFPNCGVAKAHSNRVSVYEPNDAEINPIWYGAGGTFLYPLSLFDQILSANFFSKIFNFLFWKWKFTSIGLFVHPAQLIESYKSFPLEALKMGTFQRHAKQG